MVVNGAQLSSYSQAKENLVGTGYFTEGIFLHFCASMISGLITTIASMPVDIVKTRIQNMKKSADSQSKGALVSYLFIFYNIGLSYDYDLECICQHS